MSRKDWPLLLFILLSWLGLRWYVDRLAAQRRLELWREYFRTHPPSLK